MKVETWRISEEKSTDREDSMADVVVVVVDVDVDDVGWCGGSYYNDNFTGLLNCDAGQLTEPQRVVSVSNT